MTQMATITVAKLYEPKGNGPADLYDEDNQKWRFWTKGFNGKPGGIPVDRFVIGEKYTVGYVIKQDNRGNNEHFIQNVVDGLTRPAGGTATPRPLSAPQQPKMPNNPVDSERMWCCANFVAAIKAGAVDVRSVTDMMEVYSNIRSVYANQYGNPKGQTTAIALNDEIPHL